MGKRAASGSALRPRFQRGERVRVRADEPEGHHRTPGYVKGQVGTVARVWDAFPNPEQRAYGEDGLPPRFLYTVRFAQGDLWKDYAGPPDDTLDVDLYEHWLEPEA